MKKAIILSLLFFDVNTIFAQKNIEPKLKVTNIKQAAKTQLQYFIIKSESNTYGYSKYTNGNFCIYKK